MQRKVTVLVFDIQRLRLIVVIIISATHASRPGSRYCFESWRDKPRRVRSVGEMWDRRTVWGHKGVCIESGGRIVSQTQMRGLGHQITMTRTRTMALSTLKTTSSTQCTVTIHRSNNTKRTPASTARHTITNNNSNRPCAAPFARTLPLSDINLPPKQSERSFTKKYTFKCPNDNIACHHQQNPQ